MLTSLLEQRCNLWKLKKDNKIQQSFTPNNSFVLFLVYRCYCFDSLSNFFTSRSSFRILSKTSCEFIISQRQYIAIISVFCRWPLIAYSTRHNSFWQKHSNPIGNVSFHISTSTKGFQIWHHFTG